MRTLIIGGLVTALLVSCGTKKEYVDKSVSDAEARIGTRVADMQRRTDSLSAEINRLDQLSLELSRKADLAINQAAGFEDYKIIWSGSIAFPFDQWELDDVARTILDEGGKTVNATPQSIVELVGHTDATGPRDYNYQLGEKRADAARRYLAEQYSLPLYRIFTMSQGEDKPEAQADQRNAGQRNRRVVINVWAPQTAGQ